MMPKLYLCIFTVLLAGCSEHSLHKPEVGLVGVAVAPVSLKGNGLTNAGPTLPVSGGNFTAGIVIPTTTAVVGRLENGLEQNAKSNLGNFRTALRQVRTNLPKVSNINSASGFDQIQLLVYAACSDLTTGSTPLMQSVYGIQPAATVATNQASLVAAGVRMLDRHVAGLASQGPDTTQINTILTNLVQAQATASATSRMAFMTVCIAANTAGTTLLGM